MSTSLPSARSSGDRTGRPSCIRSSRERTHPQLRTLGLLHHRASSMTKGKPQPEVNFIQVQVNLDSDLSTLWKSEACPTLYDERRDMSKEDLQAYTFIKENTKLFDSHGTNCHPHSTTIDPWCFIGFSKKFNRDPSYFERYPVPLNKYIQRGDAELIPQAELKSPDRFFVPHHGVEHGRKDLKGV